MSAWLWLIIRSIYCHFTHDIMETWRGAQVACPLSWRSSIYIFDLKSSKCFSSSIWRFMLITLFSYRYLIIQTGSQSETLHDLIFLLSEGNVDWRARVSSMRMKQHHRQSYLVVMEPPSCLFRRPTVPTVLHISVIIGRALLPQKRKCSYYS